MGQAHKGLEEIMTEHMGWAVFPCSAQKSLERMMSYEWSLSFQGK